MLLLLCMKVSLSHDSCEKSVEHLSIPKKLSHTLGDNFFIRAVNRALQPRRQARVLRDSVKERVQEIEKAFNEQAEDIRIKRESVEIELQSAKDHLKTAQNRLIQSKIHSEAVETAQLKEAIEQARTQLREKEVKLQQLKEKQRLWVLSTKDQAEENLRKAKREEEKAERDLMLMKVQLESAKKQLLVERYNKFVDHRRAEQNVRQAIDQVKKARSNFKRNQWELQELVEMLSRQSAVLREFIE